MTAALLSLACWYFHISRIADRLGMTWVGASWTSVEPVWKPALNSTGNSACTSEVRDIFDRPTHVPNDWWQLMCSRVLQPWDCRNSMMAPVHNITNSEVHLQTSYFLFVNHHTFLIFLFYASFSHLVVFHLSLSDSKSPQPFRTVQNIPAISMVLWSGWFQFFRVPSVSFTGLWGPFQGLQLQCHFYDPQLFLLSGKIQVFVNLFIFFYFHFKVHWNWKTFKFTSSFLFVY